MIQRGIVFALVIMAMAGCSNKTVMAQATDKNTVQTADGPAACEDFQKNDDGSWTPLTDIKVIGEKETISVQAKSASLKTGMSKPAGVDVGAMLDEQCH